MYAVVLAGGSGTRVVDVTKNEIPKILISIDGRPFVDYLLTLLTTYGITDIYFSTGFLGEKLEEYFAEYLDPAFKKLCNIYCVQEPEPLGTGGALLYTLNYANNWSGSCLVLNGDTAVYSNTLQRYINFRKNLTTVADSVIVYEGYSDGSYALLKTDSVGRVLNYSEKQQGRGFISTGWYLLHPFMLKNRKVEKCSLEYDVFPERVNLTTIKVKERDYIDIGTSDRIPDAENKLKKIKRGIE